MNGFKSLFIIAMSLLAATLTVSGCTSSDIIDDEGVPAAVTFELDVDSQAVLNRVKQMEHIVAGMCESDDTMAINNATMAFIRAKRYGFLDEGFGGQIWATHAGTVLYEAGIIIEDHPAEVAELLEIAEGMTFMHDPVSGYNIDFPHLVVVTDIYYTESATVPNQEIYINSLFSWGGDLETFLLNIGNHITSGSAEDYNNLYSYSTRMIGTPEASYFSEEDYYADLDGVNIEVLLQDGVLLSDAIEMYYTRGLFQDRETLFISAHGGKEAFEETVRCFMLGEIPNAFKDDLTFSRFIDNMAGFNRLMRRMMSNQKYDPTDIAREAAMDAFLNKVMLNDTLEIGPN